MANQLYKADLLGDALLDQARVLKSKGMRIKAMVSDGCIDDCERDELEELAQQLFMQSDEISLSGIDAMDIAACQKQAVQLMRLGRTNKHVRYLQEDVSRMRADIQRPKLSVTELGPSNEAA